MSLFVTVEVHKRIAGLASVSQNKIVILSAVKDLLLLPEASSTFP
jgi:hypothetical protein